MTNLLISMMLTWTDVFMGFGNFFQWIFKGMRMLAQGPNVIFGSGVIFLLAYWTIRLMRYKKQAQSQNTYE